MTGFAACQMILDYASPFGLLGLPFVIAIPVLAIVQMASQK